MAPCAIVLLVTSLSLVQAFRTRPQRHYLKQALAVELTSGVGLWQQCGGKGWAGPTRCDSGLVCKFTNEWYSQCEPGAGGDGSDSDLGCCKFGSTCADCGNDGTGWCHKSASNCETCTGSFDASAAAPICNGDVDHGDDDRNGSDFEKGPGVVKKYGRLQVKGGKLVDKDGHQVYLKGMSFFWSMWTADYWTAENVRVMARQWNVSVLRAAVGVTDHDPSNDVRGNPALNHRLLETVVNACIEEGIYVIIDWHDHDAHLHQSEAIAFFEKYGKMYGDKENILWETWNEPNAVSSGISWWEHCKPYHEKVVPVIRKYSENVIILGSPDWSRKVDDAARDPVKGDNLAYALHFYTNYHKQDIRDVADWALQHGVAIFVSEWGLWNSACTSVPCDTSYLDNADEGDRWMQWCDRNRVSWVAWAIYDKAETPAITKQRGVFTDSALTPAGKYYKRQILR